MDLLSSDRQDAVRLIREHLTCILCKNLFVEPQALDCKHNFCANCISYYLSRAESFCPTCRLPTRPSESTRNQSLESLLAAWKVVEQQLQNVSDANVDNAITANMAEKVFSANTDDNPIVWKPTPESSNASRGSAPSQKWNVDISSIKQTSGKARKNGQSTSTCRSNALEVEVHTSNTGGGNTSLLEDMASDSGTGASVDNESSSVMQTQDLDAYMSTIRQQEADLDRATSPPSNRKAKKRKRASEYIPTANFGHSNVLANILQSQSSNEEKDDSQARMPFSPDLLSTPQSKHNKKRQYASSHWGSTRAQKGNKTSKEKSRVENNVADTPSKQVWRRNWEEPDQLIEDLTQTPTSDDVQQDVNARLNAAMQVEAKVEVETLVDIPTDKFMFVSTDVPPKRARQVLEACKQLGARFGPSFDCFYDEEHKTYSTSVTHLLTRTNASGRCKRTAKYMRALAEGCYIVDVTWVEDSAASGKWITDMDKYEVIGDMYSDATHKPREARQRRWVSGKRNEIFRGLHFVLLDEVDAFGFQMDSLNEIVGHFGGRMTMEMEEMDKKQSVGIVPNTMSCEEARACFDRWHKPIVRVTWLFDSISHLEVLSFDDYYPY